MSETTLAEPLAAAEIIKAVGEKVMAALRKDCYLAPDSAYEHFTGTVLIRLEAVDLGRKVEVSKLVDIELGARTDAEGDDKFLLQAEHEFEIEAQAPNTVRVETDQPVPVLVENGQGRPEIKRVKYGRHEKRG